MRNDVALRDLCELIVDCPHSTPKWTDSGVLVLRSNNIRGGRLDLSNRSFTDEAHYMQRSRRAELRGGDLVITREAPMGQVCMIPDGLRCCLGQRMVLLRPNNNRCDGRYLLYALQSPSVQHQIAWSEGTGSTVSNLRIPHLEALCVSTPHMDEQVAIAAVLGSLEDKIAQNRRTEGALEGLARATFKAWFVDFEPVKAKAAGKTSFPGMPPDAFAALPGRLTDSSLGPVPQGWKTATLRDVALFVSGGTPSKKEPGYWGGEFPWVSAKDMHERIVSDSELRLTAAGRTAVRKTAPRHATLIVVRGMSLMTEVRIGWCTREVAFNQDLRAFVATGVSPEFLFVWLSSSEEQLKKMVDTASHGTGRILTDRLDAMSIARPPEPVMQAFDGFVGPVTALRESLAAESSKLAALRDYLLPRLLSGRVRATAM